MRKCAECGRENAIKYYRGGTQCDYCYKKHRRKTDSEFVARESAARKRWREEDYDDSH
jgi:DNA-directed RNA polymerase subunit RPC12/RpoP